MSINTCTHTHVYSCSPASVPKRCSRFRDHVSPLAKWLRQKPSAKLGCYGRFSVFPPPGWTHPWVLVRPLVVVLVWRLVGLGGGWGRLGALPLHKNCSPHMRAPLLGSAGHGDNHSEVIGGAWLRMTARGPDFEPPWSGSRPPTWEEWVEEGWVPCGACFF